MSMRKNGTIELLRLIFSVIIVIFHSQAAFGEINMGNDFSLCFNGRFCVEFFFLISGALMARHVDMKAKEGSLGHDTFVFMKRKYLGVFPYMLFCFLVGTVAHFLMNPMNFSDGFFTVLESMPDLFMVSMSGVPANTVIVSYTWYLSAMMLAMLMLYPFLRKNYDAFTYIAAPLITLLSLGYLTKTTGGITDAWHWTGFAYKGLLRALGEISLGCICYRAAKWISSSVRTRSSSVLYTALEVASYATVITFMSAKESDAHIVYLLPVMAVAVTLTLSGRGVVTDFINRKIPVKYLGEFSLCIYVCQTLPQRILEEYFITLSPGIKIIAHVVFTCIYALVCCLVVHNIRKYLKFRKSNKESLKNSLSA
ncbi:MAG: acyltransferase [Clostridia bacterium]|nr:acyltransferase [Clostridia bacterium]